MPTMLEVEPEVASKIQVRARERGVSIDLYLRELIDQKGTESEKSASVRKSGFSTLREWASGHCVDEVCLADDAISRENI